MSRFTYDYDPETFCCRGCGAEIDQISCGRERFLGTGQELMLCGMCGLGYLSPDFTDAELNRFYREDYRRVSLVDAAAIHDDAFFRTVLKREFARVRVPLVAQHLPPNATLLEIGSGFGAFLGALHAVRPDVALFATESDETHRHHLLDGAPVTFLAPEAITAAGPFDAIVVIHTFEHLKHPVADAATYAQALTPTGKLYIEVPDMRGEWMNWLYVQPSHLSYFTADSLRRTLLRAGVALQQIGSHPLGEVLADTLWAVGHKPTGAPAMPVAAPPEEIEQLLSHIARYRWNLKQTARRILRSCVLTLIGIDRAGRIARARYYRANKRHFTQ